MVNIEFIANRYDCYNDRETNITALVRRKLKMALPGIYRYLRNSEI